MTIARNTLAQAIAVGALILLANTAQAQCRSFVKNKCAPEMAPYKFNENYNAAELAPGEEVEVNLTFYSGQDYRVMVCPHVILGEVNWKLVDASGKAIFESLADDPKRTFDLRVESTQQLKVVIFVPERSGGTVAVNTGCVAIMVGFKE